MISFPMKSYEAQAKIFKALMHPSRLAILDALREGEQCVCSLEQLLGYRQAYISQHLTVLREAGLVENRRDGWNIFYQVTRPEVYNLLQTTINLTDIQIGQTDKQETLAEVT